jgi:hypothetical protein
MRAGAYPGGPHLTTPAAPGPAGLAKRGAAP